ncbi:MAG: enoyl-CoA hydratase/isomerase family protein [Planctomycetes bacterium]|nr:enoyl-CoA hydratase/isomerase family protein [Planctomycetota bacterium]
MDLKNVKYESKNGIAFITVNRPDKLNALNDETISELIMVFHDIAHDDCVLSAIVTGAGNKAFIAGADVAELSKNDATAAKRTAQKGQLLTILVENLGKPVIAAINGFTLGGGCEFAMACTIRIASENAKLGQPEVNLGIIPGYGGTQRLPRIVGKGRAMEMILTGDAIDAQEAWRIGLVNKVVPQDKLLEEAEKMARKIMSRGPLAVRYSMEAINAGLEMALREGLTLEANLFSSICATNDMKEGMTAFLEKRTTKFQGQ